MFARLKLSRLFRRRASVDLEALALELASRLHSGAPTAWAWQQTLRRHVPSYAADTTELSAAHLHKLLSAHVKREESRALGGICAAVHFSAQLGAPLAEVLEHVAQGIAHSVEAAAARATALAGPKTSAYILAFLPLLGLGVGMLFGANPLATLGDGALGTLSGALGVLFIALGIHWIRKQLLAATLCGEGTQAESWVIIDLVRAGLKSGNSLPAIIEALASALDHPRLRHVSSALLIGVPWEKAWELAGEKSKSRRGERDWWPALCSCLEPAWRDGVNPENLLAAAAQSALRSRDARAREEAARLAVRLVLPLGLCFLPAFALIGVVPLILQAAQGLGS